jgi:purine-nucleoside phosphorylase
MVKILGANCVGMSTVPEVIVRHMSIETFLFSVITDIGDKESDTISRRSAGSSYFKSGT